MQFREPFPLTIRALLLATSLVLLLLLPFVDALDNNEAYGHGISTGLLGRPVRIDNEQFSDIKVSTDGGFIKIIGTVVNLSEQEFRLSPYIFVTKEEPVDSGLNYGQMSPFRYYVDAIYPPHRDPAGWYFRVEHNLPNPLVLESGERVDYEIRIYPLKAGVYHVHSYFVSDDAWRFIGRGQTITVTGTDAPTVGEITQLYLPFALGVAAFAVLIARISRIPNGQVGQKRLRRRKTIRVYFAAKSAFETAWLSGVLFWIASATYSYLYALQALYLFLLPAAFALAAITFGGYAAAIAKSRIHHLAFATGTSAATAAFHFVLLFVIDYFKGELFRISGQFAFAAIIVNSGIAIYLSILLMKARRKEAGLQPKSH